MGGEGARPRTSDAAFPPSPLNIRDFDDLLHLYAQDIGDSLEASGLLTFQEEPSLGTAHKPLVFTLARIPIFSSMRAASKRLFRNYDGGGACLRPCSASRAAGCAAGGCCRCAFSSPTSALRTASNGRRGQDGLLFWAIFGCIGSESE